jgi:hypothetical protein
LPAQIQALDDAKSSATSYMTKLKRWKTDQSSQSRAFRSRS